MLIAVWFMIKEIGNMKYIKSPMNYTGGKYKLLPQILPLIPENIDTFVDLFTGGANVAININAKKIIANDIEKRIINIYKFFQTENIGNIIKNIESLIEKFELSMENVDGYNEMRSFYNHIVTGKTEGGNPHAPLMLFVLICYSFNHQFRFNSKGEFNMPFGKDRSRFNDTMKQNLINFHMAIREKNIIFTDKDFTELKVDKLTSDDLVYCDPPYLITCATYNEKDGWNETREKELLSLLDSLNDKGIRFALSNVLFSKGKTNDLLIDWGSKYNIQHLDYTYKNCNYHTKDKTSKPDEVLITNY